MINVQHFDPYARIAALILNKIKSDFTIAYQMPSGEIIREYKKGDSVDKELFTTQSEREEALKVPSFSAVVKSNGLCFSVYVDNVLEVADFPLRKTHSKIYNGFEGMSGYGPEVFYPEARTTLVGTPSLSFNKQEGKAKLTYIRPFYQYYIRRCTNEEMYISGPSSRVLDPVVEYAKPVAILTSEGVDYVRVSKVNVYDIFEKEEEFVNDNELIVTKETTKSSFEVILSGDFGEKKWFLSQTYGYKNSVQLDPESILLIIKLVSSLELDTFETVYNTIKVDYERRRVVLPLVRKGSCYALEGNVILELVSKTENADNLTFLDEFKVFDKGIGCFDEEHGYYYIIAQSHAESCFALSLATTVARQIGRNEISFILRTLQALIRSKALLIDKTHRLYGDTGSGRTFDIIVGDKIPTTYSVRRESFSPSQFKSLADGLYMLGFDNTLQDHAVGVPDHWITVNKHGDQLLAVYDSYGLDPFVYGEKMNAVLSSGRDVVLARFIVTNKTTQLVLEKPNVLA